MAMIRPKRDWQTMALGREPADRSILPFVRGSDWHRPSPSQVRSLSKTFAIIRGVAGFAVLGLAGVLVQSSWKPGVVFLILFVSAYNFAALFAFYRGSDRTVVRVARGVGVIDVGSFFLMLWTFGPTPPGALIACYIALLNVAVALDGAVGATASASLFIAGFAAFGAARTIVHGDPFPATDFVLWSVVIAILAVSLASIQHALTPNETQGEVPASRVLPAPTFHISPREHEVLQLVAQGYSNTMIANRLHLSDNTVKGYVEALLTRLNARNRAEAVATASRLNLL
jgi:DNA-binding CsgD family transcriptional regulator